MSRLQGLRGSTQGTLHRTLPSATHTPQAHSSCLLGRRNISPEEGAAAEGSWNPVPQPNHRPAPVPRGPCIHSGEAFTSWLLCAGHLRRRCRHSSLNPVFTASYWRWDFKGHLQRRLLWGRRVGSETGAPGKACLSLAGNRGIFS